METVIPVIRTVLREKRPIREEVLTSEDILEEILLTLLVAYPRLRNLSSIHIKRIAAAETKASAWRIARRFGAWVLGRPRVHKREDPTFSQRKFLEASEHLVTKEEREDPREIREFLLALADSAGVQGIERAVFCLRMEGWTWPRIGGFFGRSESWGAVLMQAVFRKLRKEYRIWERLGFRTR